MLMDTFALPGDQVPLTPSWSTGWVAEMEEDNSSGGEPSTSAPRKQTRTLAPNLTRRSHKKSRAGCFSCKARKIKCGEEKPTCKNCAVKSSDCVYPNPQPRRDVTARRPSSVLSQAPAVVQFTLNDMQFFHHFLTIAYPHLPLGNDDVWVRDIPQFAQEHTYLMHAMLALGASHLDRLTPIACYQKEALMHRGHAISGLNKVLAQSRHDYGEADAMLATCYALTFQSSYMADGLQDFITFVRGCALATGKIRDENAPTAFNLAPDRHYRVVEPRLRRLPSVNPRLLAEGLQALDGVQTYLQYPAEYKFFSALRAVFTSLQQSSPAGYLHFVGLYSVWYDLCHDSFKVFLDPNNTTVQLLFGFFIGIQMIMVPLTAQEWPERSSSAPAQTLLGITEWMDSIVAKVPGELQYHLSWPRSVVSTVVAEVSGMPYEGPSVLQIEPRSRLISDTGQEITSELLLDV